MGRLSGKRAIITGAASGIGRALTDRLAAEGVRLAIADIEAAPLETARAELEAAGAAVIAVVTDVTEAAQVEALRDATLAAFGATHIVINNAGVSTSGPVWNLDERTWAWVLNVNLWGVIHGVRTFVPGLVAQGEGHVVNTSSMQGLAPTPGGGAYAVSKHAVVALSEVLQADLRAAGVDVGVSVLCPGPVQTRIYDSERNRPDRATKPAGARSSDQVKAFLDAKGMAPSAVADLVLDAIYTERFYVLTDRSRVDAVVERARAIAEGDPTR